MLPIRQSGESELEFNQRVMQMENSWAELYEKLDKYEKLQKFMPQDQAWESVFGPISDNFKKNMEALKASVTESRNAMKKKYEKILETMNGKKDD